MSGEVLNVSSESEDCSDEFDDEEAEINLSQTILISDESVVLSTQQVYAIVEKEVQHVRDVVDLPKNKARSLLNEFKWDRDKLLESLFDGTKKAEQLLKIEWKIARFNIREKYVCGICLDDIPPNNIRQLPCNHRSCTECLTTFLAFAITEEGGLSNGSIKCPGENCDYEIDDDDVLEALQDAKIKQKYQQMIANSFVDYNRNMKWCPGGCENVLKVIPGSLNEFITTVRCDCRHWFCFKCSAMSHDPATCDMLEDWAKVKKEDLDAQAWIVSNTQACPKCAVRIEKNGGCNHMTCKKCRYEFCWVCMAVWQGHRSCSGLKAAQPRGDTSGLISRRFSDYNMLKEAMHQSYDLDVINYKPKMKVTQMETAEQFLKIEFVAHAIEMLLQCRRTLMNSYIFSYFMTSINNQMFIFEDNCHYLQQVTEALSYKLEHDVNADNIAQLKHEIIDATKICNKRRQQLIDHVKEGYDRSWWHRFPIPVEKLQELEAMAAADDINMNNLL